jgi:hypothetical protein
MLGEFLPGNHGSAARRRGSDYRAHHIKTALAAAKARGKRLGTPDPAGAVERMRVARKAQAAQFAANVLPIIRDIQAAGHTSLNAIAGQLIPGRSLPQLEACAGATDSGSGVGRCGMPDVQDKRSP